MSMLIWIDHWYYKRHATAGHAGRDEPRRMHTKGPAARHPYTCGSIPQHNTLQHQGSMEPMLGKMGLPSKISLLNKMFADGHTASNAPDLF